MKTNRDYMGLRRAGCRTNRARYRSMVFSAMAVAGSIALGLLIVILAAILTKVYGF